MGEKSALGLPDAVEVCLFDLDDAHAAQAAGTTAAGVGQFLRLALHIGDELGDVLDGQLCIHHQNLRIDPDHADRLRPDRAGAQPDSAGATVR